MNNLGESSTKVIFDNRMRMFASEESSTSKKTSNKGNSSASTENMEFENSINSKETGKKKSYS